MLGKTIQNYIAAIAVVVFGLWMFSEKPLNNKSGINKSYDYSDVRPESDAEYIYNDKAIISAGAARAKSATSINNAIVEAAVPEVAVNDTDMKPAITSVDDVSDDAWFSGIMQKARSISDRVIHIDITGNTNNGMVVAAGENNGIDENSLLPQPTESEVLAENKPDCSAMLYMGGNAYGKNMLIKMGCPVP